jgi:hypothetical protein
VSGLSRRKGWLARYRRLACVGLAARLMVADLIYIYQTPASLTLRPRRAGSLFILPRVHRRQTRTLAPTTTIWHVIGITSSGDTSRPARLGVVGRASIMSACRHIVLLFQR